MAVSSLTLLMLSGFLTLFGLVPCLGWLNWFAIPLSFVTVVIGVVGLATDRDPQTGAARGRGAHLLAVVLGILLVCVGSLRWMLGAGIL
jgi:hypothetical protein